MKSFLKLVVFGVMGLAVLVGGLLMARPDFADSIFQPEKAGIRAAENDGNRMIVNHAKGIEKELAQNQYVRADGTVDLDAYSFTRKPRMYEIAKAQDIRDADLDIANRRIPIVQRAIVTGKQSVWVTMAPVHEPMHVTVASTDFMKPHPEAKFAVSADGVVIADYAPDAINGVPQRYRTDQTVVIHDYLIRTGHVGLEWKRWRWVGHNCVEGVCTDTMQSTSNGGALVDVPNAGNFYELVGEVCQTANNCGTATPMGTDSVICPGGNLRVMPNGRVVVDNQPDNMSFSNGVGGWRLNIVPDEFARQACEGMPRGTIIKTAGREILANN